MTNEQYDPDFLPALGKWVRFTLAQIAPGPWIGFVYFDREAGLSLKGGPEGTRAVELPAYTLRLPMNLNWRLIEPHEANASNLPDEPSWLHHYGPQPKVDDPWRLDPHIRPHLHPQLIDDVQVLVHDGEPRRTGRKGEACWLRIRQLEGYVTRCAVYLEQATKLTLDEFNARYGQPIPVYSGLLLNAPFKLQTVQKGSLIYFLPAPELTLPLQVTLQYLEELQTWEIIPCNQCGLAHTLDPPSIMFKTRFPDSDSKEVVGQSFTSFCVNCSGMQMLMMRQ